MSVRDLYLSEDAVGLAAKVRAGEVSAQELLEVALALVDERDAALGAVVVRDDQRARQTAAAPVEGPLTGVPFLLKDLYADMAGLALTNGSRLFADHVPAADNHLVEAYKRAGLVIFGRSASPEFGLTTATESTLHGVTRNPWSLEHTSGGSSGGASAAVAAGMLPAGTRQRRRWLDPCPGLVLWAVRAQAEPRSGVDGTARRRGVGTASAATMPSPAPSATAPRCSMPSRAPGPATLTRAPAHAGSFAEEVGRPTGSPPDRGSRIARSTARRFTTIAAKRSRDAVRLCGELGHQIVTAAPDIDAEALGTATRTIIGANIRATIEDRAAELGREARPGDVEPLTWGTAEATPRYRHHRLSEGRQDRARPRAERWASSSSNSI